MAIDYSALRWDDLLRQAQADHAQQWNAKDTFDPFSSGMTNIGGHGAQIYAPDLNWGNASFNLNNSEDPNQPLKHMTRLTRGDDGGVKVDYYDMNRGFPVGAAMVLAAPFAMSGLQGLLGGAEAAGAGGWLSAEGGAGYLGGLAADAGELAALGSSGAGATLGNAASGAGEAATGGGWVSAEGGAGYAGGMAADAAGGGMLDTILSKGIDFLGSKAGSAITGGLLSGLASKNAPTSTTSTNRVEIDPRMANILYGADGNSGFLSQIMGNMNTPQKPGMANLGLQTDNFLNSDGFTTLQGSLGAATGLQNSNIQAPQVQAPQQNNLNLAPAYNDMIYGAPGGNPYLTGAIQRGINQSSNAFSDMLSSATRNITENVMPSIRSGARVSGNYGSDREGIAQGKALDTFNTQMGQALQRFGQGNTDAAIAAQAGAYDTDRNRQLAAMSGLSGQQYGVAGQNANLQMQTNVLNSQNRQAGIGASQGLLNQMYNIGQNNDAYTGNKLGQTAGLLSPFTGLGATQTQTQPLYNNTLGNIAGGAMAGLGIYNMFNKG